jgi:hypothetical protein
LFLLSIVLITYGLLFTILVNAFVTTVAAGRSRILPRLARFLAPERFDNTILVLSFGLFVISAAMNVYLS